MRPDRIEELLRRRPPDERPHRVELGAGPVLAPAEAARPVVRVRLGRAAPALAVMVAVVGIAIATGLLGARRPDTTPTLPSAAGASSSAAAPSPVPTASEVAGLIPWLDEPYAAPSPEPTPDPAGLPLCEASNVALLASGWGGATGSMAGGVRLISLAANPCHLETPTRIELVDAGGSRIATSDSAVRGEPGDQGSVAVAPGAVAGSIVVWSNWCGPRPPRPLSVRLTLPLATDGVGRSTRLVASVDDDGLGSGTPRCDAPGAGSSVGVLGLTSEPAMLGDYPRDACTPADLLAFRSAWGPALGTSYSRLVLVNGSSFDCTLPEPVTVELRDRDGTLLLAREVSADAIGARAVPAGGTAMAMLAFANWCDARPATPLALDVGLPSGRLRVAPAPLAVDVIPVPPCMSEGSPPPPAFEVEPLAAPPAPEPPPSDAGDALPLRVELSVPDSGAPGTDLTYTVTLTDVAEDGQAVDLPGGCPSYVQRLFLPDGRETTIRYRLNCAGAGTMVAGDSRTFEMRIAIPDGVGSGAATLIWQLGDRGPSGPKTTFQVSTAPGTPGPDR